MATFTLTFNNVSADPMVTGDQDASLTRLENLVKGLKSGSASGVEGESLSLQSSSAAASGTVTFSGAATAADTVTINGTALTATKKNATQTFLFNTVIATDAFAINDVTFTCVA